MSVTVAGVVPKETWVCVCETPILKKKVLSTVEAQQWDHCARSTPQTQKKVLPLLLLPHTLSLNHPMIAIVNVTPQNAQCHGQPCRYEVKVNHRPVATFTHLRGDGLYRCLMRAAAAVLKERYSNKEICKTSCVHIDNE